VLASRWPRSSGHRGHPDGRLACPQDCCNQSPHSSLSENSATDHSMCWCCLAQQHSDVSRLYCPGKTTGFHSVILSGDTGQLHPPASCKEHGNGVCVKCTEVVVKLSSAVGQFSGLISMISERPSYMNSVNNRVKTNRLLGLERRSRRNKGG
jgi:hypothetical protein